MKLPRLIIVALVLLPCISYTADLKSSYYRVADLSEGDHLNVRSEPSATSSDIGDLARSSRPWEVLETDPTGRWGRIVWQESNGWVALRYMTKINIKHLAGTIVPIGLDCAGSEPFWLLEIESQDSIRFTATDFTRPMSVSEVTQATNNDTTVVAISSLTSSSSNMAVIRNSQCTDGKTESKYGWSADVITQSPVKLYSGCCFLRLPVN